MFSWLFSNPLAVGTPAPPFILPDEEGSVFVLNLHRNRNVVLIFYPGDETPICRAQLCQVRDRWELVQKSNTLVFGVNPQPSESHSRFKQRHSLPFPLLVDNGQRVARLYHAHGLIVKRTVYLIGGDGLIHFSRRGKPPIEEVLAAAHS